MNLYMAVKRQLGFLSSQKHQAIARDGPLSGEGAGSDRCAGVNEVPA